jgi:hypothetical protein
MVPWPRVLCSIAWPRLFPTSAANRCGGWSGKAHQALGMVQQAPEGHACSRQFDAYDQQEGSVELVITGGHGACVDTLMNTDTQKAPSAKSPVVSAANTSPLPRAP